MLLRRCISAGKSFELYSFIVVLPIVLSPPLIVSEEQIGTIASAIHDGIVATGPDS